MSDGEYQRFRQSDGICWEVSSPEPGMELKSHSDGGPGFWNLMRCHYAEKKSLQDRPPSVLSVL